MSGVVKGVKKTFKKVANVAKKVAPFVLAAAAVYFTAGAALGATAGWGATVGGMTQSLGLTGTLGNIVTGAATQAGYGAAIGAATSAITGGDMADGALYGALGGAVTGGVTGGLGINPDPLAASGEAASGAGSATPSMSTVSSPSVTGAPGIGDVGDGLMQTTSGIAPRAPVGSAPAAAGGGSTFDNLLGKGGWVERNGELVGGVVKGVGQGVLSGLGDQADIEAAEKRRRQTQDNYRVGTTGLLPGANTAEAPYEASGNPSPASKYPTTIRAPQGRAMMRYVYDRDSGSMKLVRMG